MPKKPKPTAVPAVRRKRLGRAVVGAIGMIALETAYMRKSGYAVGLQTAVRCRAGHLFTTIWIPGASVKAVRLGPVRLQWCPVGRHFTSVRPVKVAELTDEVQEAARLQHDARIP
ncbi:hypothetical protein [Catenulispora pinisilvae]|uniref:hypothetical protein n=1 Tax=Catenulispora pinisilvae TaxID=2705253 RepID=UPI001891A217|nr:hypothetical protein [Catenulispora pinisilvae]